MKAITILLLALAGDAGAQIKPGVTNTPVPLPVKPTLTLEVQRAEGGTIGDLAVPEEWVTSMSIASRALLRFRFGIKEVGITLSDAHPHAEWRVYEGPPPPVDIEGAAPNLIARGDAGEIPTILKPRTFLIDFGKNLLPATPNGTTYFVNVVGRDHKGAFIRRVSPSVPLTYQHSTFGTSLQVDSLKVLSVVPQAGTLVGKRKQTEPLTAANSIEIRFAYELISAPQAKIKQWLMLEDGSPVKYIDLDDWITVPKGAGTVTARISVNCVRKRPHRVTRITFGLLEGTVFLVKGEVPIRGVTFLCPP